jgi:endonuclease/exonuclease/phosphatase (EEP) superfamily protein YafD
LSAASFGLASLNVCGLPSALPPLRARAPEFCRRIEDSDIDVVNFQEVWTRRYLQLLRAGLPSFGFVAWRAGAVGQPAGGLATFSRVPVGSVSFTSFRGARPRSGGPLFRLARTLNSRLQGVLTVELTAPAVAVVNVHLTANKDGDWSAGNRYHPLQRAQLERLHEVLRRVRAAGERPVIVAGDFNVPSRSVLYPLVVDGWQDLFADSDPPTFHAELLRGRRPSRIDYVLVSDGPAVEIALLFEEAVPLPGGRETFLSDHVGLMARVPVR